jgi:3-hydroxymyristoyl/3-hydroxydecanoyl-(acyl carrier protein) dehydratase
VVSIPHREPFLFVKGDGQGDRQGFVIDAAFDKANPYVADGSDDPIVPRPLVLEALAQALAVLAHRDFDATQSGVLAMLKEAEFVRDVRCSDRVELHVKHHRTFAKLWWYAVRAVTNGEPVASAQIVVAHLGAAG